LQTSDSSSPAAAAEVFLESLIDGDISTVSPEELLACAVRATSELLYVVQQTPVVVGYDELPYLTKRQQEILEMLGTGLVPKQVYEQLCIAPKTMESHLNAINRAFTTHGYQNAVKRARMMGILV
jgi:DNA-binding NarL/FixJ family response regulator